MCIELNAFRKCCFVHALGVVNRLIGGSAWSIDLAASPRVRAMAWDGKLGKLAAALATARLHAAQAGLTAAAELLDARMRQLNALLSELAAARIVRAEVVVLDDDWGKPGRAKRILAWIAATGADAGQVAERFQLALSTAKKYLRRARREAVRAAA